MQNFLDEVKRFNTGWAASFEYANDNIKDLYNKSYQILKSNEKEIVTLIEAFDNKSNRKYKWISMNGAIFSRDIWKNQRKLFPLLLQKVYNCTRQQVDAMGAFLYGSPDFSCRNYAFEIVDKEELDFLDQEINFR